MGLQLYQSKDEVNALEDTPPNAEARPKGKEPRRRLWVRFVHFVISQRRKHIAETEKESTQDKAARLTAKATKWIAFLTFVMVVFNAFTLWEIYRGGADTTKIANAADQIKVYAGNIKDAAQQTTVAAQKFSTAASEIDTKIGFAEKDFSRMAQNSANAIRATQEQMRQDQRAWMGLDKVSGKPEVGKPFDVYLALKNTGRTPAKNVTIYSSYDPEPVGHAPNFGLIGEPINVGFVSPNAVHFFIVHPSRGKNITKEQMPVIDTFTLFVHGILTYQDIYGRKHWFTYCLSMEKDGSRYDYYSSHNDVGDGDPPYDLRKAHKPN